MHAIASAAPIAVAIALSAAPILALVLVAVTTRPARVPALFLVGWAAGILAVASVLVLFVDLSARPRLPETAGAIVRLVLGAVLAVLAIRSWRRRGATEGPPGWLAGIARWSPLRAFVIGFALVAINPKYLALIAYGATAILERSTTIRDQVLAIVAFACIASIGIATPIVLRELGGPAANRGLERATRWMTDNGTVISTAVIAVIAVVLIVKGLAGL